MSSIDSRFYQNFIELPQLSSQFPTTVSTLYTLLQSTTLHFSLSLLIKNLPLSFFLNWLAPSEKWTHFKDLFLEAYGVPGKHLQVDTVSLLAQCGHIPLPAETGFGQTQIAEHYSKLFQKSSHLIVLDLSALDALGDDHVSVN